MEPDPSIGAVAALDDELRWGMYAFIRAARRPVTRDDAAAAVGISRKLAAFHLDKLVAAGVLRSGYAPVAGTHRVGRAPKVYEPVDADIRVSIPQRRPDLLADILLDAVLADGDDSADAALRAADERGREVGTAARERIRPGRLGAERGLTLVCGVLGGCGFEPVREQPTRIRLRDCPFHPFAARAPKLVCGVNRAFLGGVLTGLGAAGVEAVVAPRPGECCVELRARD